MVEAVRDCIIGSNESRGAYARPHMVPAFAGLRKGAIQAAMQAMHGLLSPAVWSAVYRTFAIFIKFEVGQNRLPKKGFYRIKTIYKISTILVVPGPWCSET